MQLPMRTPPARDTLQPDTLDLFVGRSAERLLQGGADAIPQLFGAWLRAWYIQLLLILPRLLVAAVAAAIILAVTLWLRARLAGEGHHEERSGRAHTVGVIGVLIAAATAAALIGATTLAAAILSFGFFYVIAAVVQILTPRLLGHGRATPEALDMLLVVARYTLITLGTVEALSTLGLNLGGILAGIGILGLAVGFAAQDTLANVIAGFVILWDRPIRVGDWVRIGEATGRVRRLTLRSTRLETRDDGILVIPNKEIVSDRVFNFSLRNLTRVRVPVDVAYDSDIAAARRVMLESVPEAETISAKPDPVVAVTELGDNGVTMELIFFITDPRDMQPLRWSISEKILLAFRDAGVTIPFPQRDLWLRNPEVLPVAGNGASPPEAAESSA